MLRLATLLLALAASPVFAAEPVALPDKEMFDWSGPDAETQVFTSGDFSLTLTMSGDDAEKLATLKVEKPGVAPVEISGLGSGGGFGQVGVFPFDDTGGQSVLLAVYAGGAHCCMQVVAATETDAGLVSQDIGSADGDAIAPVDIDGDGIFELPMPDGRFTYTFDAYAFSYPPTQIFKSAMGKIYEASALPQFRPLFAEELERARADCSGETWNLGACAGLLGMAARLGTFEAELATVQTALAAGKRTSGWDDFDICGNDDCTEKQSFADFGDAVTAALQAWGYLKTN